MPHAGPGFRPRLRWNRAPLLDTTIGSCRIATKPEAGALDGDAASDELAHDDSTSVVAAVVDGPPGPASWHVFKHRLSRQERR